VKKLWMHWWQTKSTCYSISNSSVKNIKALYIEHCAGNDFGGFVITTSDNSIKSVTGFSRFQFSLEGKEAKIFHVTEEANYNTKHFSASSLVEFTNRSAKSLLERKILTKDTFIGILSIIKQSEQKDAYRKIENLNFNENDVKRWESGLSFKFDVTTDFEFDPTYIPPTLLQKLNQQIELKARTAIINAEIRAQEDAIAQVFKNQNRLRDNIKSLEKVENKELVNRYLKDLNKEEDELLLTRARISELQVELSNVEKTIKNNTSALIADIRNAL